MSGAICRNRSMTTLSREEIERWRSSADQFEAHLDEGGKFAAQNVYELIRQVKALCPAALKGIEAASEDQVDELLRRAHKLLTTGAPSWETHNGMIAELATVLKTLRNDNQQWQRSRDIFVQQALDREAEVERLQVQLVEKVARAIAFSKGGEFTAQSRHRASDELGWKPEMQQLTDYAEKHWKEYVHAAGFAVEAARPLIQQQVLRDMKASAFDLGFDGEMAGEFVDTYAKKLGIDIGGSDD